MNETLPRGQYGWSEMSPFTFSTRIKDAAKKIAKLYKQKKFDAVAFTGSSGGAIAFYLAAEYQIPLLYVRKDGEKSHGLKIESNSLDPIKRYLIVDDFVDTGSTVRGIITKIAKLCKKHKVEQCEPIGLFCYASTYRQTVVLDDGTYLKVLR